MRCFLTLIVILIFIVISILTSILSPPPFSSYIHGQLLGPQEGLRLPPGVSVTANSHGHANRARVTLCLTADNYAHPLNHLRDTHSRTVFFKNIVASAELSYACPHPQGGAALGCDRRLRGQCVCRG